MPNQERSFVIVHPEIDARKPFTGHAPKQAASKALSYLRRAKLAGKGKTVVILKEANTDFVKKHNEKKGVRKINTDKELAYIGESKKLKKPVVIEQDGRVFARWSTKRWCADWKNTSPPKSSAPTVPRSVLSTRRAPSPVPAANEAPKCLGCACKRNPTPSQHQPPR